MIPDAIIVFTDGASRGNPGPGGWGAVLILPAIGQNQNGQFKVKSLKSKVKVVELGGREEHTTNNRMELAAAIQALSYVSRLELKTYNFKLYSDSSYLINGITKWIGGWRENGWKTKAKKEVENRDLWEKLAAAASGKEIEWRLITGHAGVAGNARCDEIATRFADGFQPELYDCPLEAYPIKNILDAGVSGVSDTDKKSRDRKRSRAAAYSYVSMVNGVIQTHNTWAACEKRVKGRRGARYQKVFSAEEEKRLREVWSGKR